MVKIRKDIVSDSVITAASYGSGNTKQYIVIHETANTKAGADAENHAKLQRNGNSRDASWHYTVDDKEAVQSFPDNVKCWHAGSSYNNNSIGIEICVNSDGNFKQAVKNAAELTKSLMQKYGIPKSHVITHREASGWKDCPHNLRSGAKGVTWNDFLKMLDGKASVVTEPAKSTPAKSTPSKSSGSPNFNTNSIVDFMNSVGLDSSFNNRKKYADKYGIKGYEGTASQNAKLLEKLKVVYKSIPSSKPKEPKGNQKTNSIVEYLDSIGVDSSFNNRAKLAAANGIKGYKGTEDQNLTLLRKLRGGGTASAPKKAKGDQKTTSLVDYLKSIGEASDFKNRAKLAAAKGIKNYEGTASQNTQLLKKLRGH
ncbi:putative endolysin [Bacillus phage BSP38]|uniref:N-acetylmuramoyl-L-alanine amidase n=1 Tax=Bacillus phage BSP38 TaxID=2283013 RepID=A0A345MJQ8_BPBSP|nr:endolysin [Bacillus phage BSP38]AXH71090.1 putative endolysin [Bacillus phage BSP38]